MMPLFSHTLKASLAITTTVGCRNLCSYCPQRSFMEAYRRRSSITSMSAETFKRCLKSVPKNICISFSGFAEPWLNADCTAMVLYAHQHGFPVRVNTTLIGMKKQDVEQMRSIPFVKFVIHLPDNQKRTRIKVDNTYLETLTFLSENPLANLHWKFHHTDPELNIHPEVESVLFSRKVRIEFAGLNNRAGNINTGITYPLPNKGKVLSACQDFRHNILLPNGEVALCHMDWSLRHVLGNLLEQDYLTLTGGEEMQKIRLCLRNPGMDLLCRSCEKDITRKTAGEVLRNALRRRFRGSADPY